MSENLQKPDVVYGVPCTCGNLAMIATRDSGTNKSTYGCACGLRYIRDDVTGKVAGPFLEKSGKIPLVHLIMLPAELETHYEERSQATGKDIPDLIVDDLKTVFRAMEGV